MKSCTMVVHIAVAVADDVDTDCLCLDIPLEELGWALTDTEGNDIEGYVTAYETTEVFDV